jgi:hypothetical protein
MQDDTIVGEFTHQAEAFAASAIAPHVLAVHGVDLTPAMVQVARRESAAAELGTRARAAAGRRRMLPRRRARRPAGARAADVDGAPAALRGGRLGRE